MDLVYTKVVLFLETLLE